MHTLQPKHTKMKNEEVEKLLSQYNIVLSQFPKISKKDPALTEDCDSGSVIKITREDETYYRVVI